ncbi:hypothetical protein ES332_D11G119400v1 [Gossypium tomentosum]|uniref:Uncharacterized protein n=1 Tax=Gossypium tomentosum TaxID=34277 RepID=A0A5D2IMN9_GOSTO|nr:hypothetical protein ES332_D11G119400v1 [Gossypium tomentosum]
MQVRKLFPRSNMLGLQIQLKITAVGFYQSRSSKRQLRLPDRAEKALVFSTNLSHSDLCCSFFSFCPSGL